jgi:hypothetical protein
MKARIYIEQQFLPWILFLDSYDTLKHYNERKEEYLWEIYNHISEEFKAIDRYELYMFRVGFNKLLTPRGMVKLIICKTPDVNNVGESSYIVIAYNDTELHYYHVEKYLEDKYYLKKISLEKKLVVCEMENPTYEQIIKEVQQNLLQL